MACRRPDTSKPSQDQTFILRVQKKRKTFHSQGRWLARYLQGDTERTYVILGTLRQGSSLERGQPRALVGCGDTKLNYFKGFYKERGGENETEKEGMTDLRPSLWPPRRQQTAPWPAGLGRGTGRKLGQAPGNDPFFRKVRLQG